MDPSILDTGFPGGSVENNSPANAGDAASIPGSGRSPVEGNGNPLQCPCPGNPMDRGAWLAIWFRGSQKSQTQQLNNISDTQMSLIHNVK